jgi:hypothetical protein
MTKSTSIQTQAVLLAYAKQRCLAEWGNTNDPPCHPRDDGWNGCTQCIDRRALAAAVYAIADKVVPHEENPTGEGLSILQWFCQSIRVKQRRKIRNELLLVATEIGAPR